MRRARARYCSWLPPQPWTKSTPGTSGPGVTTVPAIRWPSTLISISLSFVAMPLDPRELGDRPHLAVDATEVNRRAVRRAGASAEDLHRRGFHQLPRRVPGEGLQRCDLGAARPAEPPGLLQHAS